jgi:flagellar hook-basal body complex protein FliE
MNALRDAAAAKIKAPAAATPAAGSAVTGSTSAGATPSFDQLLNSLTQSQGQSDGLVQQLATGGDATDLSQVMIGLSENDINFRVTLAIRDKLVDAYQEVMKMQV